MLLAPLSRFHDEATAFSFSSFFLSLIAAAVDYSGSNCNEIALITQIKAHHVATPCAFIFITQLRMYNIDPVKISVQVRTS